MCHPTHNIPAQRKRASLIVKYPLGKLAGFVRSQGQNALPHRGESEDRFLDKKQKGVGHSLNLKHRWPDSRERN